METTAEEVDGGFIINGSKTWISNAPVANVFIIWARCKWDNKVRGFILEKVRIPTSILLFWLPVSRCGHAKDAYRA